MDSNGLADPYVKLHLLPGASKVLGGGAGFCQALGSGPEAPPQPTMGKALTGWEGAAPPEQNLSPESAKGQGGAITCTDMFVGPSAGAVGQPLS